MPSNKIVRGPLAQRLEQGTHNALAVGSIPTRPTIKGDYMNDSICTACGRLSSEHILCSYDKVTRYCPGGPGPSKEEELESIKKLLSVFEKLGI